jgi:hypothetical protein
MKGASIAKAKTLVGRTSATSLLLSQSAKLGQPAPRQKSDKYTHATYEKETKANGRLNIL